MNIGFGQVVECAIDVPSDADVFRFHGSVGSVVILSLFDAASGCGGSYNYSCPTVELFGPGETVPTTVIGPGTVSGAVELTASGTWAIRVTEHGNDQATGYRIGLERLFPHSPTAQDFPGDSFISDETIDPVPDHDFYTFGGFQGAFISLSLTDRTSGCGGSYNYPCPSARLYAPDESEVANLGPGSDITDITLPQDGVYNPHVWEYGYDKNETYNLGLQCVFPPDGRDTCWEEEDSCGGLTCNGQAVTLCGTVGSDDLVGTSGDDVIAGRRGHDRIDGGGGDDTICGGTGKDTLLGGEGDDHIYGEVGDDVLVGGDGNDRQHGGPGRDALLGNEGRDRLRGDGGDDILVGGAGTDLLQGGGLNDVCDLDATDSAVSGGCEIQLDP